MLKTKDPTVLSGLEPDGAVGFDPVRMMETGFCLVSGDDIAFFEDRGDGIVSGHYFLKSRGRNAISVAESFLSRVFEDYSVVTGLTPVDNKAALWMTRRLGFQMLDVLETEAGLMQLSMLKKEFK